MVYVGLLTVDGKEPSGYYRKDLSQYRFKISPPRDDGDQLVFVLDEGIKIGPIKSRCDVALLGLWNEVTGGEPFAQCRFVSGSVRKVRRWDWMYVPRGMLTFGVGKLPRDDPPGDDQWPKSPAGPTCVSAKRTVPLIGRKSKTTPGRRIKRSSLV